MGGSIEKLRLAGRTIAMMAIFAVRAVRSHTANLQPHWRRIAQPEFARR